MIHTTHQIDTQTGADAGDETRRLQAVHDAAVLDTPPDARFDALTRLAATLLDMPMAMVTLADDTRLWVKSGVGGLAAGAETPRHIAFCTQTISQPAPIMVVADMLLDLRYRDNPLVTAAPHIRFYAGAKLIGAAGWVLGTLCVLDTRPRVLSDAQLTILADLAACASGLLDLYTLRHSMHVTQALGSQSRAMNPHSTWIAGPHDAQVRIMEASVSHTGPSAAQLEGRAWHDLVHEDDRPHIRHAWQASMAGGGVFDREARLPGPDGEYRWSHIRAEADRAPDGTVRQWFGVFADISDRKRRELQQAHAATHDALTGLPNRVHFMQLMAGHLGRTTDDVRFALFSLDLDNLTAVNNTHGFAAGDAVLREVADRLRASTRRADIVARCGGDEFLLLRLDVHQPSDAAALAQLILAAMAAPMVIDGHTLTLGMSIGITLCPCDGTTIETLLPNASLALARAKSEGRGTSRFFTPEQDEQLRTLQALNLDLGEALAHDELHVAFQPLVHARSGALTGFEALLRWRHPQRGEVSPVDFIPAAETTGLIVPIGQWILQAACRAALDWPDHLNVAVNLSSVQFKSATDLLWMVALVLSQTGLAPRRLELEITESLPLLTDEANLAVLRQLRSLGVRIALDDFGTGYSSLAYLQAFPFDKLKIDKSIAANATDAFGGQPIVRAIVAMSHAMGISVTAEGVETRAQYDALRDQGCDQLQGFLISPPVALANLPALIDRLKHHAILEAAEC